MEQIIKLLSPYFSPYFTDTLWVVGAIAFLALWMLARTTRVLSKIQDQRELDVNLLQNMAKIWKKAKFVPEDARDREAKNLYKEFMQEVRDEGGTCPVVVRKGKPRVMKKEEYDRLVGTKEKWLFSPLLLLISILYAGMIFLANGQQMGIIFVVSLIVPVVQFFIAFVINAFKKKKNRFRNALFYNLQETAVDFFNITRPYILRNCYPDKIVTTWDMAEKQKGREKKVSSPFVIVGEPSESLIKEAIAIVERQQSYEEDVKLRERLRQEEEVLYSETKYTKVLQAKIEEANLQTHLMQLENKAKQFVNEEAAPAAKDEFESEVKDEATAEPRTEIKEEPILEYPEEYPSMEEEDRSIEDVPLPEPPALQEMPKEIVEEVRPVIEPSLPVPPAEEAEIITKETIKEALKEFVTEVQPVPETDKKEIRSGDAFDMLAKMAKSKNNKKNTDSDFSVDSIGDALEQEIAKRKRIS